jgi:hypothetical protein
MDFYRDLSGQLNPKCYTSDRGGQSILLLVCHNTEGKNENNTGQDVATAQERSDFEAAFLADNTYEVSIHYVIGEEECNAPTYRVVPEEFTAYHCGGTPPQYPSSWTNPNSGQVYGGYNLNQVAIGIELVGQHYETVGPNQAASLKLLVEDLVSRYPILKEPGHIIAHASLEADRQDGRNWVDLARTWATEANQPPVITPSPLPTPVTNNVVVEPGLVDGPGFLAEAESHKDTLETDEQYAVRVSGDASTISFAWGKRFFYFWDSVTNKVTSYLKVDHSVNVVSTSIEMEASLRGEVLRTQIQKAVRKADGSVVYLSWSDAYVYFFDGLTHRASSYKKAA